MIFREGATLILLALAVVIGIIGYSSSLFLGDDNPIEESCEAVIKKTTGFDLDLTPNSPEGATGATAANEMVVKRPDPVEIISDEGYPTVEEIIKGC
jgi:hypothetical protein